MPRGPEASRRIEFDQTGRGRCTEGQPTIAMEAYIRLKRFRLRAVRIDSTVVEAVVRYPTDAGQASSGVKVLAREGRKLAKLIGEKKARVTDRSKAM